MACYDVVCETSLPLDFHGICSTIDDILTHLLAITTYISHRFFNFIENLVLRDDGLWAEDVVLFFSGQQSRFSVNHDTSLETCEGTTSDFSGDLLVNKQVEILESTYSHGSAPYIFDGLMLPLFGLQLAWRLALASCRISFYYVKYARLQVQSIVSRVQKTLRGSSDDIGWLQHTPGMAPVRDGTGRFLELLENIRNGVYTLPDSFVYLLIPGLFSNHGPLYFVTTKKFFSKMGLACHIAKIHSEASVEHNAWELKQYIEELYWGSGKRVMLLGHSKGGVDAAASLSLYWSELKDKVAGLALVQSPYGGTPVASDILRDGQIADKETRRIMELLICKVIKGDIRALEDLTYDRRKEFIMKHKFPNDIPVISFHSEASIAPGVLATMTHIAHAELPWLPLPDNFVEGGCHQVPVVVPISAAMAVCALHLQLRYGEKSDGLVTCRDAEVPGSVIVRPEQKLDHAWMVYSSRKKNDDSKPDACEMCEAVLTLLVELGKTKERK